jgi:hypothetical protein
MKFWFIDCIAQCCAGKSGQGNNIDATEADSSPSVRDQSGGGVAPASKHSTKDLLHLLCVLWHDGNTECAMQALIERRYCDAKLLS